MTKLGIQHVYLYKLFSICMLVVCFNTNLISSFFLVNLFSASSCSSPSMILLFSSSIPLTISDTKSAWSRRSCSFSLSLTYRRAPVGLNNSYSESYSTYVCMQLRKTMESQRVGFKNPFLARVLIYKHSKLIHDIVLRESLSLCSSNYSTPQVSSGVYTGIKKAQRIYHVISLP